MLRVASVNVNGIRAAFRRGMGTWLASSGPDVLLLQEVRADDEILADHLSRDEWHLAHEAAEAKGRAGVAIASRLPMRAIRIGIGTGTSSDSGRWVEADLELAGGGVLTAVSVYVHSGTAGEDSGSVGGTRPGVPQRSPVGRCSASWISSSTSAG